MLTIVVFDVPSHSEDVAHVPLFLAISILYYVIVRPLLKGAVQVIRIQRVELAVTIPVGAFGALAALIKATFPKLPHPCLLRALTLTL